MPDGTTQVSEWRAYGCVQIVFARNEVVGVLRDKWNSEIGVRAQFRLGLNSRRMDRCLEL